MTDEQLLELAETFIIRSKETGSSDGVQKAMIASIAASLLVIARK